MVAAEDTFFQIKQSMTARHSGTGPDLSRVGVEGSHMSAWPQFRTKLLPPAMVEAILAGRGEQKIALGYSSGAAALPAGA
jgi:hypothetical protein